MGTTILNAPDTSGAWTAKIEQPGEWTFVAIKEGQRREEKINIVSDIETTKVDLWFSLIPAFTYSGKYEIVDNNDSKITETQDNLNWKIRFLTSGDLSFTELRGAENGIDVFLVGGGGGGGSGAYEGPGYPAGGGYYQTSVFTPKKLINYPISIGAGGIGGTRYDRNPGLTGGKTTAFNSTVNGGTGGGDGQHGKPGVGGTATGEFSVTGNKYSGNKGRGSELAGISNTGQGGGGGRKSGNDYPGKNGGSGIVIIRAKRT